jgi:hypothetical protein
MFIVISVMTWNPLMTTNHITLNHADQNTAIDATSNIVVTANPTLSIAAIHHTSSHDSGNPKGYAE